MRQLLIVSAVVLLMSGVCATAQVDVGGYFSALGKYTTVNESGTVMPSAGVGIIFNGRFGFGAMLAALVPTIHADSLSSTGRPLLINLIYYGGTLEYIHNPDDFLQYGGGLLIGAGSVSFAESTAKHHNNHDTNRPNYSFGFIEPEVAGQFAFNENFRLRASFGWRAVFARDAEAAPAGQLSGPVVALGFRIGLFTSWE